MSLYRQVGTFVVRLLNTSQCLYMRNAESRPNKPLSSAAEQSSLSLTWQTDLLAAKPSFRRSSSTIVQQWLQGKITIKSKSCDVPMILWQSTPMKHCSQQILGSARACMQPSRVYAKTKAQISCAVTSAFVFTTLAEQSLFFLNPKFQASGVVQPDLCRIWSETPKTDTHE